MIDIRIIELAGRKMLDIVDYCTIPIDRIKYFDWNVSNGGASGRSVQIVTDDPSDEFILAFDNRDALKAFLEKQNGLQS